ncbi:MAG TPA: hypothetical protein VNS58_16725 [Puia sp.]|nr:hypothetical protein [Puia sp.]
MKKLYFSALIFCGLFVTAQTNAQSSAPVTISDGGEQGPAATFNAYSESNSSIVMIRWKTSDEKNIDHFVVEHSTDGTHFDPLHAVVARGGSAVEAQSYEDGDSYPAAKENYYRLAIVSKDGNSFYSPVMKVDMTGKKMPALAPTVLHMGGTLRVEPYYRDPVTVNFFNESGMRVGVYMVNGSSFNISTSGWGKGLYFYRISDASHPLIDAGKIMVL